MHQLDQWFGDIFTAAMILTTLMTTAQRPAGFGAPAPPLAVNRRALVSICIPVLRAVAVRGEQHGPVAPTSARDPPRLLERDKSTRVPKDTVKPFEIIRNYVEGNGVRAVPV